MRKITFSLLLLFVFLGSNAQQLSTARYLEDLGYFGKQLPEKHVNLFAKLSKAKFEAMLSKIKADTNQITREFFAAQLAQVLVAVGDEHTFVDQKPQYYFPIRFEHFDDGFILTGLQKAEESMMHGKLLGINGIPIAQIISQMKTQFIPENTSYFAMSVLSALNNAHILAGLKIIPDLRHAAYEIADLNGNKRILNLSSITKPEADNLVLSSAYAALLRARKTGNYWYDYDKAQQTLYFSYNKCSENADHPFAAFNEELFKLIASERPKKIIVDLRANGGGNSAILRPFIEAMKNSYLNRKNSFFVIIGKRTFSSALMNAVEMKRQLSVTLVGEQTGGNVNHFGEVRGFQLPNSKLIIGYSTRYWETWKGKKGGLQPDIPIRYNAKSFLKGEDEALSAIAIKTN